MDDIVRTDFLYNLGYEHPAYPITFKQVIQEILTLFDINKPTMPRAFNVLEGLNQGQILVDDPLNEMIPLDFDDGGRTYFFTERLISYISLNNHW